MEKERRDGVMCERLSSSSRQASQISLLMFPASLAPLGCGSSPLLPIISLSRSLPWKLVVQLFGRKIREAISG